MHHPRIWERHCRRELFSQLEAKGKLHVPKGDANDRYDASFHRTAGRVLVPHDHDALLAAQERLQQNAYKYNKGNAERQSLKKRCQLVKKQIKVEQRAIGDLEQEKQDRKVMQQPESPGKTTQK